MKNNKVMALLSDKAFLRKKIAETLRADDLELLEAESMESAIKILQGRKLTSIISDKKIFKANEHDFIKEVKSLSPSTEVIFFLANKETDIALTDFKFFRMNYFEEETLTNSGKLLNFIFDNEQRSIKEKFQSWSLSSKQMEILEYIKKGECNKTIANELSISEQGVKYHVSILLTKFGVSNRRELQKEISKILLSDQPVVL